MPIRASAAHVLLCSVILLLSRFREISEGISRESGGGRPQREGFSLARGCLTTTWEYEKIGAREKRRIYIKVHGTERNRRGRERREGARCVYRGKRGAGLAVEILLGKAHARTGTHRLADSRWVVPPRWPRPRVGTSDCHSDQ